MTESENYYSEAEVQELIKELEQSIEDREELQRENSELSSEVSTLKNELQKKSQKIVSLNEQIETMSESDLELKQSEEQLQNAKKLLEESESERNYANRKWREAETMVRASDKRLQEAEQKNAEAEKHIQSRVDEAKAQLERESAQKLAEAIREQKAIYSYPTYVLGAFSLVVTLVYAIDMWDIIKTIPAWFVNRWHNIQSIFQAIETTYLWIHDIVPKSWTEIARHGIPIAVLGFVAWFFIYSFLIKGVIGAFRGWNRERWEDYARHDETGQRKAFTAFWCAVALLLSICISDVWKECPLNFLSIFLILFFIFYVLYHTQERNG